jgi:hypothetical protein
MDELKEASLVKASERVSDLGSAVYYIKRVGRLLQKHGLLSDALDLYVQKIKEAALHGIDRVIDVSDFE